MNETIQKYKSSLTGFWNTRSKSQKWTMGIVVLLTILLIVAVTFFSTRTALVPLYSNLSPAETGSIKESLDSKGITSEISEGGTAILVPTEMVDTLKVQLASEGLPKTGSIDYSFFSQNAGFGMTDNEFNVLKLDAMQTELALLIKSIEGVQDASVMISLPEQGIFVNDQTQQASASIVLQTQPGYQFEQSQISGLYNLVSKSVPNLPTDNIVIMNQFFEYFELENVNNSSFAGNISSQMDVKKQIERDIQQQVQSMLGTLIGFNKVVVSVSTDIDFTQEAREENLVVPVDEENLEGITMSAQRITETFTGEGANAAGGVPAGEDPADSLGTTYVGSTDGDGDYERIEETMNYEVSRVMKEIVESPYKVRDIGIQVMVEPPTPDDPTSLPLETQDDITQILSTIIRTSIDKESNPDLTPEAIEQKVVVSVAEFNGKQEFTSTNIPAIPWWVYVVGGILLAVIILLIFMIVRSRKNNIEEELVYEEPVRISIPDVNEEKESETTVRKKQLEKMARDKPEEFAKLLRTWMTEE
ncbi:flagellar M-ring protein FliF [Bacillus coahuilensis m2-6]|uniref:flagellar basal-body MS-ring/collar protein FliF n=1 Tax=Bacillus coahuilensis TaxID=408580 RepID=UPI0007504961|nr:flagellar basal-body MS-ring/collar protein FliF [Bacillus coahuilensis]KUP08663.1 flagellar M-ring protein FliF [Bacillus coahuilensis m2-6]